MVMLWYYTIGGVLLAGLLIWLPTRLKYRITRRHFQISLFGLPVRWVNLANIEKVSKHHSRWAEPWWNTWRPSRRRIMIQRRRGLMKNLVVTPKFRYEFKGELERAVQRVQGLAATPGPAGTEDPLAARSAD